MKFIENTDGWSTIELMIILPFIFLILMAIIQFGWLINAKLSLTHATRAGAREYATTAECGKAVDVVRRNFISDDVVVSCYLDGDKAVIDTSYTIPITLPLVDTVVLPGPHTISAKSVMLMEKK